MQVLVFKTNLRSRRHVSILEPVLAVHPYINQWNVDLQDRDKVLRIETEKPAGERSGGTGEWGGVFL